MFEFVDFDGDYVRRLKAKDPETEEHFGRYFRSLLLATLRRRLSSADEADDACQTVFLRVLEGLDKLREGEKFGAFVMGFCKNVVREQYRPRSRTVPLDESHERIAANLPNPETEYDLRASRDRVRRTLVAMSQRDARDPDVLWAIFAGDDKDEICRRYHTNRRNLRVLLFRAKERFRKEHLRRPSGRREIDETFGRDDALPPRDEP
jgi:RNA polymerase sigma-70 factor, ECF subfamily